jgi:hypothetical protein
LFSQACEKGLGIGVFVEDGRPIMPQTVMPAGRPGRLFRRSLDARPYRAGPGLREKQVK